MALHPSGYAYRLGRQALALQKRMLSYRKQDWELEDYPIVFETQDIDPEPQPERLQMQAHLARIVNWWLTGTGGTRADALAGLGRNFQSAKTARASEGRRLPRPGARVPVQWANDERIAASGALADDFVQRVLGFEWAMMSDESSLWDFHVEETNEALFAKIREVYGVDVEDIESARICEILERIQRSRSLG